MVAKGRVDFNKVVSHVLSIFVKKFRHFKLSIGTMERLMQIIRITRDPNANKDLLLSSKIKSNAGTAQEAINFCIKCFKGHFTV